MDRLPEQVVEWHNRHPLAKRISIYDVHTIGVVALPFMRTGSAARLPGQIEPVLTDAVSDESLAAWGSEDSTVAANTNAAHLDALADQEEPQPAAAPAPASATGLLQGLLRRLLPGRAADKAAGGGATSWPAFSERFVGRLSAARIAAFARQHGYSVRPGDASWPQRVVPIDDRLMSRKDVAGGAWPYEIWLMSAAIDAGRSRTRILAGRTAGAAQPPMLGPRCLDPKRVGLAALIPLCLVAGTGAALWQRGHAPAAAEMASAASSASSGVVVAATAPAASAVALAAASEPAQELASAPVAESAVSTTTVAAASAATEAASEPASAATEIPDIRPRLVEKGPLQADRASAPPMRAAIAEATPARPAAPTTPAAAKPASAPTTSARGKVEAPSAAVVAAKAKAAEEAPEPSSSTTVAAALGKPGAREGAAAAGGQVVALVGPPMRNKAEAEATLVKMRELVLPMQPDSRDQLQSQLFESPDGWRAAVWPFSSRIEAQLINATLVARGLHTKAVNF